MQMKIACLRGALWQVVCKPTRIGMRIASQSYTETGLKSQDRYAEIT